ncbi:MAG: DUF255 domain-containing protein [Geminicoccaceae bacterium]
MPTALAQASSPYLLQHQDNPACSNERGDVALARAENRPILLSVGYAACHWCHVMAHESLENPDIAAVMNRHFVNIKVDREERPDVDADHQGRFSPARPAGWLATMFLTPDGEPFWAAPTSCSSRAMAGPGLPQLLEQVAQLYRENAAQIANNRVALTQSLQRLAAPEPGELPTPALAAQVARQLAEQLDTIHVAAWAVRLVFPQAPPCA